MTTDPREFEHPIDGTTPNELPTVLGVGSLTPEAIEAVARAMHSHQMVGLSELAWLTLDSIGRDYWTGKARAALTAAYPLIAAQAKGEALAQLADDFDELASRASYGASEDVMETWLEAATRARTATIESEA